MDESDELTVVARAANEAEANVIGGFLESQGIRATYDTRGEARQPVRGSRHRAAPGVRASTRRRAGARADRRGRGERLGSPGVQALELAPELLAVDRAAATRSAPRSRPSITRPAGRSFSSTRSCRRRIPRGSGVRSTATSCRPRRTCTCSSPAARTPAARARCCRAIRARASGRPPARARRSPAAPAPCPTRSSPEAPSRAASPPTRAAGPTRSPSGSRSTVRSWSGDVLVGDGSGGLKLGRGAGAREVEALRPLVELEPRSSSRRTASRRDPRRLSAPSSASRSLGPGAARASGTGPRARSGTGRGSVAPSGRRCRRSPGPVVEGRRRREDRRAEVGEREHVPQVDAGERRLPHGEDERAALLERDVGSAADQVVRVAGGDRGERLRAARGDDHAACGNEPLETAAAWSFSPCTSSASSLTCA